MRKEIKIVLLLIVTLLVKPHWLYSQERELQQFRESHYQQCRELIEAAPDSTTAASIATYLVEQYRYGSHMDGDFIAIKLAKEYFLNGKLEWRGRGGLPLLQLYVEFNQETLLAMEAPPLTLTSLDGKQLSLSQIESRYTLLYFFDHNCSICREEFPKMSETLYRYQHLNIELYAIYAQPTPDGMLPFIEEHKELIESSGVKWNWVYDPEMATGFHRLYNVLTTPKLYLLDQNKKIVGRTLNSSSLKELLNQKEEELDQLHTMSEQFVPQYLSLFDFSKEGEFESAFEPLYNQTVKERPKLFEPLFFHLFELLANSPHQHEREAATRLAKEYIVEKQELWFNHYFTKERVPSYLKIRERSKVGAHFPTLVLHNERGRVVDWPKNKVKFSYIYLFTTDCPLCKPFTQELKAIYREIKKRGGEVVALYIGERPEELKKTRKEMRIKWPLLYSQEQSTTPLQSLIECSGVPMTYLLNSEGQIEAKEINTIELLKMVNN